MKRSGVPVTPCQQLQRVAVHDLVGSPDMGVRGGWPVQGPAWLPLRNDRLLCLREERASGGGPESIAFRVMAGLGSELGAAGRMVVRMPKSAIEPQKWRRLFVVGQAISPRTISSDRLASDNCGWVLRWRRRPPPGHATTVRATRSSCLNSPPPSVALIPPQRLCRALFLLQISDLRAAVCSQLGPGGREPGRHR